THILSDNATSTTDLCTLSLHDALPISQASVQDSAEIADRNRAGGGGDQRADPRGGQPASHGGEADDDHECDTQRQADACGGAGRSEEHTSELQSRENLVCRLLLEKKKT